MKPNEALVKNRQTLFRSGEVPPGGDRSPDPSVPLAKPKTSALGRVDILR